ncbi:MAG: TldD/PmbA family protein, partial [Elusimicrobia bacterium]|nr:TldD/PmbA family protein [Elusimicrobiota bacterium]
MADDLKAQLKELVSHLETIVPYACALHKKRTGVRISVNRVQESVDPEDPARGLVLTLWNGQSFYEYAANDWTWPALKERATEIARIAASERDPSKPTSDIDPGAPMTGDFKSPFEKDPESVPLAERLGLARERMKRAVAADPLVANAVSILGNTLSEDTFVNRTKAVSQKILRSDAILVVFVSKNGVTVDVHSGVSKNAGLEAATISDGELRRMVEDAKRLLTAPRLEPGIYDVVTDPEWSGIIAHECFGHGMETDLYVRQRALSQRYIGKPVSAPIVNMFDDPSDIREAGGFFFDDEGQPATRTHIIKDGVLQRGLTDLASAHKLRLERSANGRRESFARKAYARMTNTFFEGGKSTKDDLIASVEDGLYLRHATNGMEDPQAWG